MADIKFSEFPKATISKDSDEIAILQDGVNKMIPSPVLESKIINKTVSRVIEQGGASLNIINLKGVVPTYADLALITPTPELNDAYQVEADGLVYVYTENGFQAEGGGFNVQPEPTGVVEEGNEQAVSGGETFLAINKEIDLNKNNYFEQPFFVEDLYGNNTTLETNGTQNVDFSWEENNGNFKFGENYLKLTPTTNTSLVGSNFRVNIPEKYKNPNGKIRFYFSYKSLNNIQFRLYFQDINGNWVNNASSPLLFLPPVENETVVYVERDYEVNAHESLLYISALAGGSEVEISLVNGFYIGGIVSEIDPQPDYTTTVINVPSGGVDLLRSTLNNITDASEANRYLILLEEGIYDEIDIKGANYLGENKDVVIVRGAGIGKTLVRTNGLSTRLAPSNYNYPGNWAGYTIDQIPTVAKHTFYIQETITFEDLTAWANDCKYTLHQDNTNNPFRSLFKNVHLIHEEYNSDYLYVIGIGAKTWQFQEFENVICDLRTDKDLVLKENGAIYWHNWNNRAGECGLKINGMQAVGCNIGNIADLCSNQPDRLSLENITTTLAYGGLGFYLDPNYFTPTPPTINDYPYSLQVTMKNVFANYVKWVDRNKIGSNGTVYANYHVFVKNNTSNIIEKGKGVIYNYALNTITESLNDKFDYVTFEDIQPDNSGLCVIKGKAVDAILDVDTYLSNDMLKFENGIFKKTVVNSECIAFCLSDSNGGIETILLK